jgi:protein-tyrosine phosphatase
MAESPPAPIRALFICHYNRKRSATAERVFGKDPSLEVLSAGTSEEAMVRVNRRMLDWADVVFVMDGEQVEALGKMFPDHPALPDVVCLNIQDCYHFLDPELVAILQERTLPHFAKLRAIPGEAAERSQ